MPDVEVPFPEVNHELGRKTEKELFFVLTLPAFKAALDKEAPKALTLGTPVPGSAIVIWSQALNGCGTCRLLGQSIKSVGRGVGARCSGFQPLRETDDLYDVTVATAQGMNIAEMVIFAPEGVAARAVPALTTPCGLNPSDLFVEHIGFSS